MPSTELQRKAIYYVMFMGLALLLVFAIPGIESWLQSTILPGFGMTFDKGWELSETSSQVPINLTYVGAMGTIIRIVTIILWMAIVIATVRFVAYLVLRTAYRSSAQPEVSSLLKTVSSIVIYIIAFFIIFQTQYPDVPLSPLFTGSTILGIVVGLALQETLGNLFAGIAMQADQPFQVGDVISITN